MAVKRMPPAGRAPRTPGNKPAPVKPGMTKGSARQRASLDVPYNPLGNVNGPEGGTGSPAPKRKQRGGPSKPNQGGAGS